MVDTLKHTDRKEEGQTDTTNPEGHFENKVINLLVYKHFRFFGKFCSVQPFTPIHPF